jgi:hypothetical protein
MESLEGGGEQRQRRRMLRQVGMSVTAFESGVLLTLEEPSGLLEVAPSLLGLPAAWSDFDDLVFLVQAVDPLSVTVGAAQGRGRYEATRALSAGEVTRVALDLADLPLCAGRGEPPDRPSVVRFVVKGERGAKVRVTAVELRDAGRPKRPPVVDKFGQRLRQTWVGKIGNEAELRASVERERAAWPAAPAGRSRTGGWAQGPRLEGSGFFRVVQRDDGRWWFVDPAGHLFWSAGVTGVRATTFNETTPVTDREWLFTALPPGRETAPNDLWHTRDQVSFYRWNILRKHGSPEAWTRHTVERLHRWGLNTIGNWSEASMLAQRTLPHTREISSRRPDAPMASARLPDVFAVEWRNLFEKAVKTEVAPHAEDPLCVGWFVDNELPWHHPQLLDAPAESALKREWVAMLQGRYQSLADFNRFWGRNYSEWSEAARIRQADVPPEGAMRDDEQALVRHYAEGYFSTVCEILRRHAPHHLYLGCRFVRNAPARQIVAAAGRYCDVVTVNCYAWEPTREQFGAWYRDCGRPILIGEHHVSLESPRQLPPLWEAFRPEQRERYYANFVETWARQPYSLGCHYFQHADQPLTGRGDGENQTIGLVDITDQPHPDLDRALRASLPHIYEWHAASA